MIGDRGETEEEERPTPLLPAAICVRRRLRAAKGALNEKKASRLAGIANGVREGERARKRAEAERRRVLRECECESVAQLSTEELCIGS